MVWQSSSEKVSGILKSHMKSSALRVRGKDWWSLMYCQLSHELVRPTGSLAPNHLISIPLWAHVSMNDFTSSYETEKSNVPLTGDFTFSIKGNDCYAECSRANRCMKSARLAASSSVIPLYKLALRYSPTPKGVRVRNPTIPSFQL